MPCATWNTLVL